MSPSELSWVASTVSLGQVVLAGPLVVGNSVVGVGVGVVGVGVCVGGVGVVGVVGVGVVVNGKQKIASEILVDVLFL